MSLVSNLLGRSNQDGVAVLAAEFESLKQADGARISRMLTYREENLAVRDVNIDQDVADLTDYGRRPTVTEPSRHNIPMPFGMALTVKHSYRIAGRLPDVVVDRREESAEERYRSDTMEKIVWAILRESRGDTQLASAAWDGSQLGAACFDMYFDPAKQIPILRAVDPAGILCVKGVMDPHEFQRVYHFWDVPVADAKAEYGNQIFRGSPVATDGITGTGWAGEIETVTIVQMCDKNRKVRFALGGAIPLYEQEHNYGFVPYTIIPNIGPERDVWGFADYEFTRAISHYIAALFSREADILRSVSNGSMQSSGAGVNPETIREVMRKGGVLETKRDGVVKPIESPDVPNFEAEHAARAVEFLKMLGFAPDAAWGSAGATSGSDRGLQLQPLIELTAMKQTNWGAGLSRLFAMAYQMIEQKTVGKGGKYRGAVRGQGNRRMPFVLQIGPEVDPLSAENPGFDEMDPMSTEADQFISLPRNPKELFDGDYEVRFVWQNRIDPDDPAFVLSELGKFQQGAQSLRTTLERLGCQSPEDEIKLIEEESERLPWLRQGMIALLKAQFDANQQGAGGGAPPDQASNVMGGLGMMGTKDGAAMDQDAGAAALGGPGQLYGGA